MSEQVHTDRDATIITEAQFIKLCDDLYRDRRQIYEFNPSAGKRDALLWMLLGCLMSLLSAPAPEQSAGDGILSSDPYADAVTEILQGHMHPPFDPRPHLAELSRRLESER